MTGDQIRESFKIFHGKKHTLVASSSLVPKKTTRRCFSPTPEWCSSKTFSGPENRGYTRATSCQKCARAGGKA